MDRSHPGFAVLAVQAAIRDIVIHRQLPQSIDFSLQAFQEPARMRSVHLRMVKLERNRKDVSKELLPVPAPDQEGVVIDPAVHADGPVKFRFHNGRGADHHTVGGQIPVLTALRRL